MLPQYTTTTAWPPVGAVNEGGREKTWLGQLTLVVTDARSAVMRAHMLARPGPSVAAVFPAAYRAPSRAASETAMAHAYPRPSSSTPATRRMRIGRATANSTNAWPRKRGRSRIELQARNDDPGQVR